MIGIKLRKLRLTELKKACASVFGGWEPEARLLSDAYEEALIRFKAEARRKGYNTKFECDHCKAPTADGLDQCWACGWYFRKSKRRDLTRRELEIIAKDTGISDVDLMSRAQLVAAIQKAENQLKRRADRELLEIEARELNEKLNQVMPRGWVRKAATMGTTYFDPRGRRRIFVPNKGIGVLFSVKDGQLEGRKELNHYDKDERQRRHIGRSNYQYVGDISKRVLTYAIAVFDLYRCG